MLKKNPFPFQTNIWKSKKKDWSIIIDLVPLLHQMLLEGKANLMGGWYTGIWEYFHSLKCLINHRLSYQAPFSF